MNSTKVDDKKIEQIRAGFVRGKNWWRTLPMHGRVRIVAGLVLSIALLLSLILLFPGPPDWTAAWTTAVLGIIAVSATLFSASASISSAATARYAYEQQLYELARQSHRDLTTGEVAEARSRLGALAREQLAFELGQYRRSTRNEIATFDLLRDRERAERARDDWFTLLWCFQRIRAVDEHLGRAREGHDGLGKSPQLFLRNLIAEQVRFLNRESTYSRAAIEEATGDPIDDRESKADLIWFVETLTPDSQIIGERPGNAGVDLAFMAQWVPEPDDIHRHTTKCGQWADSVTTFDPVLRGRLGGGVRPEIAAGVKLPQR